MTTDKEIRQRERLVALVAAHPGLDAIGLKGKGWRPQVHGPLRDAERADVIVYRNGGWYVASICADCNLKPAVREYEADNLAGTQACRWMLCGDCYAVRMDRESMTHSGVEGADGQVYSDAEGGW